MKRFLSLFLAIALSASLCACGKTDDDEQKKSEKSSKKIEHKDSERKSEKKSKDKDGKITISVGGWPDPEGDVLDKMNGYKEEFEKENPNITIVPDTWTFDLKTFYPKAETGTLPDLIDVYFSEIQNLTSADYIEDITEAAKEAGFYENINPKIRELVSTDGKMYAIPTSAYTFGLHYNVKLFEEAGLMNSDGTPKQPHDWYELAEMAKTIKETTGKDGFVMPTMNNVGGWIFTNIAWSFGVDFMEERRDGSWEATFDTPEAVAALQYIKDLKWKYDCIPSNILIDFSGMRELYATGQAAMLIDSPNNMVSTIYAMDPDDFGIMALPRGPKRYVALVGGRAYIVAKSKDSDKKADAALKWIDFKGDGYNIDSTKAAEMEKNIQDLLNRNGFIGVRDLYVWKENSEAVKLKNELIDKYCNINPNHVKLYNEFLLDSSVEFQPEESICAQELYGILDSCIQTVLSDKDADCAEIMNKANKDFQKNYLDMLN